MYALVDRHADRALLNVSIPGAEPVPYHWELIDLSTGQTDTAPHQLSGRAWPLSGTGTLGPSPSMAVFAPPARPDVNDEDDTELLVVDLTSFAVVEVPQPPGWPGTYEADAFRVGSDLVVVHRPDTSGRLDVFVDGAWSDANALAGPNADAVRAFLADQRWVTFWAPGSDGVVAIDGLGDMLWERPDLAPPPHEGFDMSPVQGHGDDAVVLLNACLGFDADASSCERETLMGLSVADGSTLWSWDRPAGVSLVADGLAVVATDAGYELIDVRTGATVEGSPTWAPADFAQECCGAGDYFFVGHDGAIGWTVSADYWEPEPGPHVKIWYPADETAATRTVDLLGD